MKTRRRCQDIDSKRAVLSTLVTQTEKCIYIKAGRSVHDAKHSFSKNNVSGTRTSRDREAFWNFAVHKVGMQRELAEVHVRDLAYGEREDRALQGQDGGRRSKRAKRRPVPAGKSTRKRSKLQPSDGRLAQQRSGGKKRNAEGAAQEA